MSEQEDLSKAAECMLPDYDKTIKECIHEMEIKFEKYGNEWKVLDDKYWKKRLSNEVDEYVKAIGIKAEERKLLNIVNIAALAIDTIENRGCNAHVVNFNVIVKTEGTTLTDNCLVCGALVSISNGIITEVK